MSLTWPGSACLSTAPPHPFFWPHTHTRPITSPPLQPARPSPLKNISHKLWLWGEWGSCNQVITGLPPQTWQDSSPRAPVSHPQMHVGVRGSETRSTLATTISWRIFLTNFTADNLEYGCCRQLITEFPAKTWHQLSATWSTPETIPRLAQLAASSTSDPSKASRGESSTVGVERCRCRLWPRPCASPPSGKSRCNSSPLSLRTAEP